MVTDTESFKIAGNEKHDNKYDYSKVEYINTNTKVEIICPIHGSFWQTPKAHLTRGYGCRKCAWETNGENRVMSFQTYVERANKVHNGKFTYIEESYSKASEKLTIVCPKHGEFESRGSDHLLGGRCLQCYYERRAKELSYTGSEFKKLAVEEHGDVYNYDKVNYINSKTKVEIVCKIHGSYYQTPASHLDGRGCLECSNDQKKLTAEEVLKNFKEVHGERYIYDKVKYVNSRTDVIIGCKKHGYFKQNPKSHAEGRGCRKCGRESHRLKK